MNKWKLIKQKYLRRGPKLEINFVKSKNGAGIPYGEELSIRVKGAEVVTAKLYDPLNKKVYTITQSSANDADKDAETVGFTMKSNQHPAACEGIDNYQLPGGKYAVLIWWFDMDTNRGGMYRKEFIIFNKPLT